MTATDTDFATPIVRLLQYVKSATVLYRKGEVVKETDVGPVHVVRIDNFPALPQGLTTTVDCHFVHVGFTEALAQWDHQEFYDAVIKAELGFFRNMGIGNWEAGPSYIEIGGWIGDQSDAFRFMGCAQAHGLAEVITPARLHITDEEKAEYMAGMGYVLLTGLKDPRQETP